MTAPRLPKQVTQHIEDGSRLTFSYRGKTMQGLSGDTVASAMFANGVRIFARSLKYHRPRGLYAMDGESSNSMVEIDGLANCRSENTYLRQGMVVKAQNYVGSPERDLMGFMDKLGWFMSAGFYYHMFHKPYKLWPTILKQIRKGAGIGCVTEACKYPRNDEMFLNTDVCVLGGGPAGMAAAKAAAEAGLRVLIIEQRPWLGGFYDWRLAQVDGVSLHERGAAMAAELAEMDNVRILTSTALLGIWGDNHITAVTTGGPADDFDERYLEARCGSVVVATGATERPLIFENNDRPGVMQFSCAHRLANTWGVAPGKQAVFAVGHDLGLEAAIELHDQGIAVAAVADNRAEGADEALMAELAQRNIPLMAGWTAVEAKGPKTVNGVMLKAINGPGSKLFDCDLLAASAGLQPVSGPLSLTLAKLAFSDEVGMFVPTQLPPKVQAAGRLLGHHAPAAVEASGALAGCKAAADCGLDMAAALKQAEEALAEAPGMPVASRLVTAPGADTAHKAFVCFDEDTPLYHIDDARRTGFDVPELAKRYTAAGTGPGQGGVPGHNLPLAMALMRGEDTDAQMPTTVRPPLTPVLISTLAGANHDIFKRTPLDSMQAAQGAVFRRIGVWQRARYFSQDFSCKAEIANVRNNVGLIDVSTLGKFKLFGPDAEKALQRVYISDMSKVKEGKLKYSAMCNDDGNILDDGVVTKTGENEYYFTTSTGRAGGTAEWFRYHTKEEGWDFNIINLTDSLAAINLAGPNARKVLAKLVEEDISHEALPYMGFKELLLNGQVMAKVLRVGFVGELSYELHLPSSWTQTVWKWLEEAGSEFDIKNFGLEAQNCLRMEKGHVIIGAESEIRTLLTDLHMGWAWCKNRPQDKKVGATGLAIAASHTGRMKLAGIQMDNPAERAKDGSLIVDSKIRGHICTMRQSEALAQTVGLVLLDEELTEVGTKLQIFEDGAGDKRLSATVVPLPFYDPEGKRLQM